MTKKELMEMLKDVKENEEIIFVENCIDMDGFSCDEIATRVYKVVGGKIKAVIGECGEIRIVKA